MAAEERELCLSLNRMLVIHKIPEIRVALDTSETLEILETLHNRKIPEPLKGVVIHNILERFNSAEVDNILHTLKVLEIRRVLLRHHMLEHLKSLDIHQIWDDLNLPFSVINDYAEDITVLKIINLDNFQQLKALSPHFPSRMLKLDCLDICCEPKSRIWDPPSDNPFGKFPNTLKELKLSCIPLQPFSTINTLT